MHNHQQIYGCRAQEGLHCAINQILLLGHKLHVALGETYFKVLYLHKNNFQKQTYAFLKFLFSYPKPHLWKQNTLQMVKQKAG